MTPTVTLPLQTVAALLDGLDRAILRTEGLEQQFTLSLAVQEARRAMVRTQAPPPEAEPEAAPPKPRPRRQKTAADDG